MPFILNMPFNKNSISYAFLFVIIGCFTLPIKAQSLSDVKVNLLNDTLYIQNKLVRFTYYWNNGNLIFTGTKDSRTGQELIFPDNQTPDLSIPGETTKATDAKINISERRSYPNENLYKHVSITYKLNNLEVKRIIKIYPEAPAISHTFFLKGKTTARSWVSSKNMAQELIEKNQPNRERSIERIGSVPFTEKHWTTTIVSFKEATDHHDNLVLEQEILPYREQESYQGNVLLAVHPQKGTGFFLIKESPLGHSQQYYNGYDFKIDDKAITIHGLGISPKDLTDEWIRGYGYAIGLGTAKKPELQKALLTYQKQLRRYIPDRDGMILANTWGDRSKDSKMNEAFILREIEAASQIGITHLQLDDGWQQGLSRNSASKSGKKWEDWETRDWQPHNERFPNGLDPIITAAQNKGVEICLWFNPSKANSYQLWERDADILIDYYHRYGIKVFKIDGISLDNKRSETNLYQLFNKVMVATEGRVAFNMDVTAGKRAGYFYFNEFGNIFLENRYTDWGNYYPHRTLRNLWSLAGYVPAERLQIEFLNNTRNKNKYAEDDSLAPDNIPFTYTSAITLVAQPLAWMEVSNLGNIEGLRAQLTIYKRVVDRIHSNITLPIGEKPSGFSWTGFVSLTPSNQVEYLMIFKENTKKDSFEFNIPYLESKVTPANLLGNFKSVGQDKRDPQKITVQCNQSFSYGLILFE